MATETIKSALKHVLQTNTVGAPGDVKTACCTVNANKDEGNMIRAVRWHGTKKVSVDDTPKPMITDAQDVVIKVTSTAICGSDLHLYLNAMPGMENNDILGHETMGYIEEVGPQVKNFQKGDRVVVAFDIACGHCFYCQKKLFSCCDNTNPSLEQEALYGHRTAGIYGYSHLTGGWDGGQAEYLRVPLADNNLIKVPDKLEDAQVLLLSDVLSTSWHATELANVGEGDVVAIWGAGPVGVLAAQCAVARGASRVIMIDQEQHRLDFVKQNVVKVETINFKQDKPIDKLKEMTGHGPDCVIEAVGFHYCNSLTHKIEMALKLETDPAEILNEMILCVRKGGRIGVVGVYAGFTNHFNIGAFMEKGLTMAAGQTHVQKYWHHLLEMIQQGKLNPSIIVSHKFPLEDAAHAYKIFNDKEPGVMKIILKPGMTTALDKAGGIDELASHAAKTTLMEAEDPAEQQVQDTLPPPLANQGINLGFGMAALATGWGDRPQDDQAELEDDTDSQRAA